MRTTNPLPALLLVILVGMAALPPTAEAQTTSRREFRAQTNFNGQAANCWLRARADLGNMEMRRYFAARPASFGLTVSVVQGITVSTATVDAGLDSASTLVQAAQQPPADATCCLAFVRSGAVDTFPPNDTMVGGVISSQAELDYVAGINADLKYVAGIGFCGSAGTFAGCAWNGTLMVTSGTGGVTIAHEVGHREGLCHTGTSCTPSCGGAGDCTDCTDASSNDIMYYRTCGANQNVLSAAECTDFRQDATP